MAVRNREFTNVSENEEYTAWKCISKNNSALTVGQNKSIFNFVTQSTFKYLFYGDKANFKYIS